MKRALILFALIILCPLLLKATDVEKELWINNGTSDIVDASGIPYTAFNESITFETANAFMHIGVGDTISFTIHNNDTLTHGFGIKDVAIDGGPYILEPGETISVEVEFDQFGAFIYYDDYNYPHYKMLGAAGVVYVSSVDHPFFYWNMKEHDKDWNDNTANGTYDLLENYNPVYFTINGLSNPETQDDPSSKIIGNVDDTLIVCMVNSGQMTHSLHLHGYHGTIMYSSKNESHEGREKDTFPIASMEVVVIYIVPDKTGIYPVHDHNLVATSGNGLYANGMFQIMEISE